MKIKSSLKLTTALALALYVNHAHAMELVIDDNDEKPIVSHVTNTNDLAIEPRTNTPSYSATFLGIEEEIKIFHDMGNAVRNLLSAEFRDSLNNVLTWIAYNESKRLYTQHSDKFIKTLADTIIDLNINLVQHLVFQALGIKDVVKATNILTNGALTPDQKPSEYIRQNLSEKMADWCRFKPLTDALNERLIAPYLVGPSAAYAIHKADIAGLMQQHVFTKIEEFIKAQNPRLIQIANQELKELETQKVTIDLAIEDLTQRLERWEDAEKVVTLKAELEEISLKLSAKAKERDAQQLVVNEEVNQMSTGTWLWNYVTSTENQRKLSELKYQHTHYQSEHKNKNSEIDAVKDTLELSLRGQHINATRTERNMTGITKALQLIEQPADGAQSKTVKCIGAFIKGFTGKKGEQWIQDTTERLKQHKALLATCEDLLKQDNDDLTKLALTLDKNLVQCTQILELYKKKLESIISVLQEELDEENESPNDSYFKIALAGMTWQQAAQPCPHIEYEHIQWMAKRLHDQEIAIQEENQLRDEILKGIGSFALTNGSLYLELTGVTDAASKVQTNLSLETLTNKKDELIGKLTGSQAIHGALSKSRNNIMESEDTDGFTKTFFVATILACQGFNIYSTSQDTMSTVTDYAKEISENVTSLGNKVRSAARPITVLFNGIKRYPVVWVVSYAGSCVLDTSMPYCSVIALGLGAMDDYGMWGPLTAQLSRTKDALFSRCWGGDKEHID